MFTNELKKGTRIKLCNGWEADMMDNKKGNIRLAKVYGTYTEIGSIYSHNIVAYRKDAIWNYDIEYTQSQERCKILDDDLILGD